MITLYLLHSRKIKATATTDDNNDCKTNANLPFNNNSVQSKAAAKIDTSKNSNASDSGKITKEKVFCRTIDHETDDTTTMPCVDASKLEPALGHEDGTTGIEDVENASITKSSNRSLSSSAVTDLNQKDLPKITRSNAFSSQANSTDTTTSMTKSSNRTFFHSYDTRKFTTNFNQ